MHINIGAACITLDKTVSRQDGKRALAHVTILG
jgi:hypothetical protein